MTTPHHKVAVLVGSLRAASFSRKMALAMTALAPASLELSIVEIGALPLFNDDLDTATPPAAWVAFRQAIVAANAVLFVTPEYNRSVPGALKNAIDVGSRPYGKSVWSGKPCAVVSVSPGALGALRSVKGRRHRIHKIPRRRAGAQQHYGQLRVSGRHRHADVAYRLHHRRLQET